MKYTEDDLRVDLENKKYEFGFTTDIAYDDFPTGLSEDIVRAISAKKEEPSWMTDWRLESYRIWQKIKSQIFKQSDIMQHQLKNQNWQVWMK